VTATPESKVKAKIRAWLKARGIWYCTPIGTGFGNNGVPDFLCCTGGRFIAIEAKAPGKRGSTTALQRDQLAAITASGGLAVVIDDPDQLEEIEYAIQNI
jgi:hypothetical protein